MTIKIDNFEYLQILSMVNIIIKYNTLSQIHFDSGLSKQKHRVKWMYLYSVEFWLEFFFVFLFLTNLEIKYGIP